MLNALTYEANLTCTENGALTHRSSGSDCLDFFAVCGALRHADENEIVRHKIMDAIGDLYLAGCRITGKLIAVCPGHPKNVELAGKLLAMMQSKQA